MSDLYVDGIDIGRFVAESCLHVATDRWHHNVQINYNTRRYECEFDLKSTFNITALMKMTFRSGAELTFSQS